MVDRIVIAGGAGGVGRRLAAVAAARGLAVASFTSAQWDVTDPDAAPPLAAGDVVVNCAAVTAVDDAEADPARAEAVNARGATHVAQACARAGAELVHVSTDYVFGGAGGPGGSGGARDTAYETDDPPAPLSVYGRTKLAGERAVAAALPSATVVRTAWVFRGGRGDSDFVAGMAARAAAGEPAQVVADQVGSPTYVDDLVDALLTVAAGGVTARVVHAAGGGQASRFELARATYALLGADASSVSPVSSAAHPRPAPRPAYSALDAAASARAGLPPLRPWRDALATALTARTATGSDPSAGTP